MEIERRQIGSNSDPDDSSPWYVVETDQDELVITEDADGGRESALANVRTNLPGHVDLPGSSAVSESGQVTYAVTESGEFIAYDPANADIPPLRAHLGWYDPSSDVLTLLEFVEE